MEPNYDSYSREELLDVYHSIDKEKYPEKFKAVELLLEEKHTLIANSASFDNVRDHKAEDPAEIVFKETKPQYAALRLTIFIIVLFGTVWFLREIERPLHERLIAIVVIYTLDHYVWRQINKFRLAKFKASST